MICNIRYYMYVIEKYSDSQSMWNNSTIMVSQCKVHVTFSECMHKNATKYLKKRMIVQRNAFSTNGFRLEAQWRRLIHIDQTAWTCDDMSLSSWKRRLKYAEHCVIQNRHTWSSIILFFKIRQCQVAMTINDTFINTL